jgi:uncharacterized membrane protein YheB (UPF0754 family)
MYVTEKLFITMSTTFSQLHELFMCIATAVFYISSEYNELLFINSIKSNPVSYEYFISSLKILLKKQEYLSFFNFNCNSANYVKFCKELLVLTSHNELVEIYKQLLTCNYPKTHEEYLQLLKLLINVNNSRN